MNVGIFLEALQLCCQMFRPFKLPKVSTARGHIVKAHQSSSNVEHETHVSRISAKRSDSRDPAVAADAKYEPVDWKKTLRGAAGSPRSSSPRAETSLSPRAQSRASLSATLLTFQSSSTASPRRATPAALVGATSIASPSLPQEAVDASPRKSAFVGSQSAAASALRTACTSSVLFLNRQYPAPQAMDKPKKARSPKLHDAKLSVASARTSTELKPVSSSDKAVDGDAKFQISIRRSSTCSAASSGSRGAASLANGRSKRSSVTDAAVPEMSFTPHLVSCIFALQLQHLLEFFMET